MMEQDLNQFLASVERKAYRMAQIALVNHADALDVVQETMIKLAQKYSHRPSSEWKPLFYRILETRLLDWHRHQAVHNRLFAWLGRSDDNKEDSVIDVYESVHITSSYESPENKLRSQQAIKKLDDALQKLPLRQQQAFLLRHWEELSVEETALVMNCSEGSVKTHFSRAVHSLREQLEECWP